VRVFWKLVLEGIGPCLVRYAARVSACVDGLGLRPPGLYSQADWIGSSYVHGGTLIWQMFFCVLPFMFAAHTRRKSDDFGPHTRERGSVAGRPLRLCQTPSPPSYLA